MSNINSNINLEETLEAYLEPMKLKTQEYLENTKREVLALYKTGLNERLVNEGFNLSLLTRPNSDTFTRKREMIAEYGEEKYKLGVTLFHEDIEKLVNKDYDKKRKNLLTKIDKLTDRENVISFELSANPKGYLDGFITLKEGFIEINTIVAYGLIQKPHYRTLVKFKK